MLITPSRSCRIQPLPSQPLNRQDKKKHACRIKMTTLAVNLEKKKIRMMWPRKRIVRQAAVLSGSQCTLLFFFTNTMCKGRLCGGCSLKRHKFQGSPNWLFQALQVHIVLHHKAVSNGRDDGQRKFWRRGWGSGSCLVLLVPGDTTNVP